MSEEQGVYDGCNVVFPQPAEEPFPPQTGDLLGAYLSKLSARVRQCEGYNAYMATLTERVAKLEESRKLGETPIENIDQLTVILNNWCSDMREWTGVVVRLEARVRELEAASTEPSAYRRSLEARIERLEALISQPESGSWRNTGSSATFTNVKPVPTGDTVCATCGHAETAHIYDIDSGVWCNGGTLGKPCLCREYKPVA